MLISAGSHRYRLAAASVIMATVVAACSSSDPSSSPEAPSGSGGGDEPITLVFESYTYGTESAGAGTQQLIDEFEADNPAIRIEPIGTPTGDIHVSVQAKAAAGDPPDVAQIGWSKFSFVLENLPYVPVEEIAGTDWAEHTDGILPEALAIGEHDGTVVGMPSIVSTPTLMYNADLFRAVGLDPDVPPTTWAQAKDAGMAIAERTDGEGVYVAVVDPAKSDYLTSR